MKISVRVRSFIRIALAVGCVIGAQAQPRIAPPATPGIITPPEGNSAFLLGRATGTQGYVCLPAGDSTASWTVSNARPEATLFTGFGHVFQIINHFLSPVTNPNDAAPDPLPF